MEQFNFIIELATLLILVVYAISVLAYLKLMVRDGKITFLKVALGLGALAFSGWALWAASLKMVAFSMVIVFLGIPMRLWMTMPRILVNQA
jgi:hypothetical protein